MMDLRAHILKVELLEQEAAEKVGLRMRLMDEAELAGAKGDKYRAMFIERILADVSEEVSRAAVLGVELGEAISKASSEAGA